MSARLYTTRRLKSASGADIKNTRGNYTRIKIHKETRRVSKVKPEIWTEEANLAYAERYPNDVDFIKPRKKKPTMVTVVDISAEEPQAKAEEEKENCCICCSELPKATTTLKCGHTFCTGCILTWFQQKNNCPMCRAVVEEAPSSKPVGRVHIDSHHAYDILDLTNRVLNGESMSLRSAFTNTRVGFDDIYTGFEKGKPMKPIILLDQGDGSRRIISGNTRLNVAEQLNIPPKAITVNQSGVPIELGKHRSLHGPGFKQGGFIDAELTEDEVLDLLQKGYNLEELCKG